MQDSELGPPDGSPAKASHPYRPDGRASVLDPELDHCLRWARRRLQRTLVTTSLVGVAALAAGIAVARLHWAGWILFAVVALWFCAPLVGLTLALRSQARLADTLRRDPGQLDWLHIDPTPPRAGHCAFELHLRDGTDTELVTPGDLAQQLFERCQGRFDITRSPDARTVRQADTRLPRLEAQLHHPTSSLAANLAPFALPILEGRSCVHLPVAKLASLTTTLDELETLLAAAVQFDATRARLRRGRPPEVIALLESVNPDPPYSESATALIHTLRELFTPAASSTSPR